MRKPRTENVEIRIDSGTHYRFVGPRKKLKPILTLLPAFEFRQLKGAEQGVDWREVARHEIARHGEPGLALRGARVKEGLNQRELARRLGIAQYNLSKMENGNRPIGKSMALRLSKIFDVDYRVFL